MNIWELAFFFYINISVLTFYSTRQWFFFFIIIVHYTDCRMYVSKHGIFMINLKFYTFSYIHKSTNWTIFGKKHVIFSIKFLEKIKFFFWQHWANGTTIGGKQQANPLGNHSRMYTMTKMTRLKKRLFLVSYHVHWILDGEIFFNVYYPKGVLYSWINNIFKCFKCKCKFNFIIYNNYEKQNKKLVTSG